MKFKFTCFLPLLVLGVSACTSPERSRSIIAANVPAATIAMQVCSSCHGMNGIAESPNFPNLAGQSETYLISQLKEFRQHTRLDKDGYDYMWGLSARLNDEQIQQLAKFYSDQKPAPGKPVSQNLANAGKLIYTQGIAAQSVQACASCHGEHAEGHQIFPRLAGQHAEYLKKQLAIFQKTDQRPEGSIMKNIAHALTEQNMESVSAYLESVN